MSVSFLPSLPPSDVEKAAQLIQRTYNSVNLTSDEQQRLQHELFEIQKRPEAWGLVVPFLAHQDPNVQFFGAHTAQVKVARDLDSFPKEHEEELRDFLVKLTSHSLTVGHSKVIIRKLFVALTTLALILVPGGVSRWPDWIASCIQSLSAGVQTEYILDFLAIVAEETETAVLSNLVKMQIRQTLLDAIPLVVQMVSTCITGPDQGSHKEIESALKCLEAWMPILPSSDLTPFIPLLINLLSPSKDDRVFVASSNALQEILSKSALSDGSGSKSLTEPLLLWLDAHGGYILQETLRSGIVNERSHSLCKLLVSIGDHSTSYIATNITSSATVSLHFPLSDTAHLTPLTKAHLTQNFLRLLLSYTSLPGFYGIDEDESEMTLGFWYLFQEALWSTDYFIPEEGEDETPGKGPQEDEAISVAKVVYSQLVQVLRRKVTWPSSSLSGWTKDQVDKFQVYRRDVGDTLINAYYILRDDMLEYYVNDIITRLETRRPQDGWEEIEASLHCVMSIQEALDLENTPHLARLFGPDILGRLPTISQDRVRRTTLAVIGTYSSWFAAQPQSESPTMLLNVIGYIVSALSDPALCLPAANALRDLCDANRVALAPHISAFAQLHAGLIQIPDTERSKVLQSIASVIQALPPEEEVPSLEAIVRPIILKMTEAFQSYSQMPEQSRAIVLKQLETLSGISKGLTRTTDSLLASGDSTNDQAEARKMEQARLDPRMVELRQAILDSIHTVVEAWSMDFEVSSVLSDLIRSITCLPSDTTLLTLPPGPLLELICFAAQRQLNAIWLSLAGMLVAQMNPPPPLFSAKSGPSPEAQLTILKMLPILIQTCLRFFSLPGTLIENPDIVRDFFGCMDTVARDFNGAFYASQPQLLDGLMECAITSLGLQERYSLVSACTFLGTFVNQTFVRQELSDAKVVLVQTYGRLILRAILCGFAGNAPRSATPNLIELLSTLVSRCTSECKAWAHDILFADDFMPSRASPEAKEKFIKALANSRSMKRIREAAQHFTLVARGLEGSPFGHASVTM